MIHELKIEYQYFDAITEGKKTFEIRKNDRNYKVGDYLALNELDDTREEYTGRSLLVKVIYIVDDERYCKKDYVVMGIVPCNILDNRTKELMYNIAHNRVGGKGSGNVVSCSVCKAPSASGFKTPYCALCDARMDGDTE